MRSTAATCCGGGSSTNSRSRGGFADSDIRFTEHGIAPGRLVTFGVPGRDGDTRPGRRRASFTWFDPNRSDLLHQSGNLDNDVVTGSFTGRDVPSGIVTELRNFTSRWPVPWRAAMERSLAGREFIGTPVAEYLPTHLVRGRAVIIGDAAHVVSPVTGAGFHNALLDVQALTAALRGAPPRPVHQALKAYQRIRLTPARTLVTQSRRWSSWYLSSAQYPATSNGPH